MKRLSNFVETHENRNSFKLKIKGLFTYMNDECGINEMSWKSHPKNPQTQENTHTDKNKPTHLESHTDSHTHRTRITVKPPLSEI